MNKDDQNREEWIDWGGGERPTSPDRFIVVRFRDGGVSELTTARCWSWRHNNSSSDVIGYRQVSL